MNARMEIIKGSSFNADTVEIIIVDEDSKIIFRQKYYYGYNASYNASWADEKKPFIGDIIRNLSEKYDVTSTQETEERNVFKEGLTQ